MFLHFKGYKREELFSAAFADMADALALELEALGRTELKGKEMLAAAAKVLLNHFDRNRDFIGQFRGAGRMTQLVRALAREARGEVAGQPGPAAGADPPGLLGRRGARCAIPSTRPPR